MIRATHQGAASAAPTFNAAAWLAAWSAIGGSYAATSGGLWLSWHEVADPVTRTALRIEIARGDNSDAVVRYLDAHQIGEAA